MKALKDYMTSFDNFRKAFYDDDSIFEVAKRSTNKGKYLVFALNHINGVAMLFTATYANRVYNRLLLHTDNNIDEWDIMTTDRDFYVLAIEYGL